MLYRQVFINVHVYMQGETTHPGMDMMYEYHSNQSGDPNNVLIHGLGHWRLTKLFHDLVFLPQAVVGQIDFLKCFHVYIILISIMKELLSVFEIRE